MQDMIFWTQEVTDALKSGRIAEYEKKLFKQLEDIVVLVRGQMTKLNRVTVGAMVTLDVHARDEVGDVEPVDSQEKTRCLRHSNEFITSCNLQLITSYNSMIQLIECKGVEWRSEMERRSPT